MHHYLSPPFFIFIIIISFFPIFNIFFLFFNLYIYTIIFYIFYYRLASQVSQYELAHSFMTFNTCYKDTGLFGIYLVCPDNTQDDCLVRELSRRGDALDLVEFYLIVCITQK